MNIRDKIYKLMEDNDITKISDLTKSLERNNLKIPYTTLMSILNGDVKDIKVGTANKLCKFFNISLEELLGDDYKLNENSRIILNVKELTTSDIEELKEIIEIKKRKRKK